MTAHAFREDAGLATVTVTFNPDPGLLERQLVNLPRDCLKILVDNASTPDLLREIEALAQRVTNVLLLRNESNLGLAAAINRGVRLASQANPTPRLVLLLDQDSEPRPGSVDVLRAAFAKLEAEGHRVGCVGPLLMDPATGLTHGFHQSTRWRWRRVYPSSTLPVACNNLNGSGTLVPLSLFIELGGLEEAFFIDHVDTEWAFRVQGAGYGLWGVPDAIFMHCMGRAGARYWMFGWRIWPLRSAERHHYLFRNATRLIFRNYVPRVWKVWAIAKLLLTVVVTLVLDNSRARQLINMWRGVVAGYRSRSGL